MTAFTITDDNNITGFRTISEAAQAGATNALTFDSSDALARIAAEWPMSRLVEIYNSIPGNGEVKKFADRKKAVARIWGALQPLGRNVAGGEVAQPDSTPTEPASVSARRKPPKREVSPTANKAHSTGNRHNTRLRHAGRGSATEVRGGSKKAEVIAMMKRPRGATLAEIMAATGWQAHYADIRIMPTCVGNPACGTGIAAMKSA
jgi:hypothetical protein